MPADLHRRATSITPDRSGQPGRTQVETIAHTILRGFDKHFRIFRKVTAEARDNFIRGDWMASRRAAIRRISLYDNRVRETINELRQGLKTGVFNAELWQEVKFHYMGLLYRHLQPELAETFYNSVFV